MSHSIESIQAIVSAVTLGISSALIPYFRNVAIKFQIVDYPNQNHKTHVSPIPYLGGLAILLPICVIPNIVVGVILGNVNQSVNILATLTPALVLALTGLIDDIRNISHKIRLFIQITASTIAASLLISSGNIIQLTENELLNVSLTAFWIVLMTNAINFFDNIDGGAAGIVFITTFLLFIVSAEKSLSSMDIFLIVISSSLFPFLFWNFKPARIYLGDCGSLFLGFMIAVLLLQYEPYVNSKIQSIGFVLFFAAAPIIDCTVAIASRLRRKIPITNGGRDHLSHRLVAAGLTKTNATLMLWLMHFFFCLLGATLNIAPKSSNDTMVFVGLFVMILLVAIFLSPYFERKIK